MPLYWPSKGSMNTSAMVAAALSQARELGLKHVVVASCSGATAARFISSGFNAVCVTNQVGFETPGGDGMPPEMRERLTGAGAKVLTTTHLA